MKQFFVSVLYVIANAAIAFSAACTPAQLQGDFNSFRSTGGGGVYGPGSSQVVSFDRPQGSPVLAVTGVTIVPNGLNSPVYTPVVNSGVPNTFSVNDPDESGSINLNIPVNLPSGAFVMRLALTTTSGSCTLDSAAFTSTGGDSNLCSIGQSQCTSSSTFVNCVATPSGNVFGGTIQTCGAGTSCVQSGSQAVCSLGNPGSTCTLGVFRCVGQGFQQCFQSGSVNKYTATQPCAQGTHCELQGSAILCSPDNGSNDVCSVGQQRCTSTFEYQVCEENALGNLVWSDDLQCTSGTSCTGNGVCSLGNPESCTPGYMRCSSSNTWQQCVQTESGWSFNEASVCASGTTCSTYLENYITCS